MKTSYSRNGLEILYAIKIEKKDHINLVYKMIVI